MKTKDRERWLKLAALAEKEKDQRKLIALASEINQLLEDDSHSVLQFPRFPRVPETSHDLDKLDAANTSGVNGLEASITSVR